MTDVSRGTDHRLLRLDKGRGSPILPYWARLRRAHCSCGATADIQVGEGHLWIQLHRFDPELSAAELAEKWLPPGYIPGSGPIPTVEDLGCFWHGLERYEGAYRVCGECGHAWATQEDLMADVIRGAQEAGASWPLGPQFVYFCPLCTHDF